MDRKEGRKVSDIQETDTNGNDCNDSDGDAHKHF